MQVIGRDPRYTVLIKSRIPFYCFRSLTGKVQEPDPPVILGIYYEQTRSAPPLQLDHPPHL